MISHPQARRVGERLVLHRVAEGREVGVSRNAPDFVRPGAALGAPLDDPFVSRTPIQLAPGTLPGSVRIVVAPGGTPVTIGAWRGSSIELTAEDVARGVAIELADRIALLLHLVDLEAPDAADPMDMVGTSAGLQQVRVAIERIVDLDVPVLIRGETGTGKELVARAIHERGPRRAAPFVGVNLGALPRELAAAELFGAVRGAYTGATRERDGLFRAAHGGTLFLDEVGEAPPEVQAMLLRVLETGELYPVGGEKPIATQVRLIAATDANIEEQIRHGRFKAPLLHRLAGYQVWLPPLRERREDIGLLFFHFARAELATIGDLHRLSPRDPHAAPWLPAQLAARLVGHTWPGNLRQLKNLTRQLVIECRGQAQLRLDRRLERELASAPEEPLDGPGTPPAGSATRWHPGSIDETTAPPLAAGSAQSLGGLTRRKPSDVTADELRSALRDAAWDLKAAADRLRIPRPSIYDLIEKHPDVRTAGDLDAEEIAQCFRACQGDLDAMVAQLQVSRRALGRRLKELGLTAPPTEPPAPARPARSKRSVD